MEKSKELKAIEDALYAYYEKHNWDVGIVASVVAFDDEGDVIDDMIWTAGPYPGVHKEQLDALSEHLVETNSQK